MKAIIAASISTIYYLITIKCQYAIVTPEQHSMLIYYDVVPTPYLFFSPAGVQLGMEVLILYSSKTVHIPPST